MWFIFLTLVLACVNAQSDYSTTVQADWPNVLIECKTTPTLQVSSLNYFRKILSSKVVVNPMLRRGSPMHKNIMLNLEKLNSKYTRFVPWFPYPRYAVVIHYFEFNVINQG
jgi:hypothetical protein